MRSDPLSQYFRLTGCEASASIFEIYICNLGGSCAKDDELHLRGSLCLYLWLQFWTLVHFCSVSAGRAGVGSRFGDAPYSPGQQCFKLMFESLCWYVWLGLRSNLRIVRIRRIFAESNRTNFFKVRSSIELFIKVRRIFVEQRTFYT